jgi:hypothetical protein
MTEFQLSLTGEERDYLKRLLDELLKQKLVEGHRTRTLSYRPTVVHEEELISAVLQKLGEGK